MEKILKYSLYLVMGTFISINLLQAASSDSTSEIYSVVVDNFNNPQERTWTVEGENFSESRVWTVKGSSYSSEGFPQLKYVEGQPSKRSYDKSAAEGSTVLGVRAKFNYKGYNYFEVTPVTDDQVGFDLPGNVSKFSVWVWGSNHNYNLEAQFEDHKGRVYVYPMGSLNYIGWKNLSINIPQKLTEDRYHPWGTTLRFIRFVVRTSPNEKVNDFQLYFNDISVLTRIDQRAYAGGEFFNPQKINAIWSNGN